MPTAREQLLASTIWGIRRPKFALTPGHFLLRLNDPAIPFDHQSATDLLHCYGHLRRALTELTGATAAQLHLSLNWQPVGNAIGEPLAETSTPTLHTFFAWPGSRAASAVLALPAHERSAVSNNRELDDQLRDWRDGRLQAPPAAPVESPSVLTHAPLANESLSEAAHSWEPEGWAERPFHVEPAHPGPGLPFRGGHWTAVPRFSAGPLDTLGPDSLVVLAETMTGLGTNSQPPFQGMTFWATDVWSSPAPSTIHLFGRQHGGAPSLLSEFVTRGGLELPTDMP
ncbi:hypothetical protein ABIB48_002017 [Arthrobacter sp. UYCu511]|uniref:hypothetical protein n=1 Tax=Arthrobacter sp. UYCu511 TaxID=3156337 RepID=UPI00339A1849